MAREILQTTNKMQDIPRDELLQKLAAGWAIRRKSWPDGWLKQKDVLLTQPVEISDLIADDWEGKPSGAMRIHANLYINAAFIHLGNKGVFIRRKKWREGVKLHLMPAQISLSLEDITSDDWEVWK